MTKNFCCRKSKDQVTANFWGLESTNRNIGEETDFTIRLKNISHSYTNDMTNLAVDDITMGLRKGKITSLLGHNGAGKSTIVNLICGLLSQTHGSIIYDAAMGSEDVSRVIGYCGSELMSYPQFTVMEHLNFIAKLKNISKSEAKNTIEEHARNLDLFD